MSRHADVRAVVVPSIARCAGVLIGCRMLLRTRGFGPTIVSIRNRARRQAPAESVDDSSIAAVERRVALVCAFYPGRAQCLERSLVLYYLLRSQGVDVRFTQGVRINPFSAHAWVAWRGLPINDLAERTDLYTVLPELCA